MQSLPSCSRSLPSEARPLCAMSPTVVHQMARARTAYRATVAFVSRGPRDRLHAAAERCQTAASRPPASIVVSAWCGIQHCGATRPPPAGSSSYRMSSGTSRGKRRLGLSRSAGRIQVLQRNAAGATARDPPPVRAPIARDTSSTHRVKYCDPHHPRRIWPRVHARRITHRTTASLANISHDARSLRTVVLSRSLE